MDDLAGFLDAVVARNAAGWPMVSMPRGLPVRSDYLPAEFEPRHVIRGADGSPGIRLVDAGDRLAFWLPDVAGSLVNPKGEGLRDIGLITTYARGGRHYESAYRTADLRKGRPVALHREADNPHDKNAVALHGPRARKPFAYVQRGKAPAVARRLDSGEALAGLCLWGPGPGRDNDSAFLVIGSTVDLLALMRDAV